MGYTVGDAIDVFGADIVQSLGLTGGYEEIVGEITRGGDYDSLIGAQQVLSALQRGGAGSNAIARKAALQKPAIQSRPLTRMNESQVPLVVFGTTGQTPSGTIQLMQHFRPEKLVVIEQLNNNAINNPAQFQVLTGAFVGAQNMFPTAPGVGSGIHCGAFGSNSLGTGIMWSTAKPAIVITLQVNFLSTGTFWGTMYGKTLA